jgi:hypothetical protein
MKGSVLHMLVFTVQVRMTHGDDGSTTLYYEANPDKPFGNAKIVSSQVRHSFRV